MFLSNLKGFGVFGLYQTLFFWQCSLYLCKHLQRFTFRSFRGFLKFLTPFIFSKTIVKQIPCCSEVSAFIASHSCQTFHLCLTLSQWAFVLSLSTLIISAGYFPLQLSFKKLQSSDQNVVFTRLKFTPLHYLIQYSKSLKSILPSPCSILA